MALELSLLLGTMLTLMLLGVPVFLSMACAVVSYALLMPERMPDFIVVQGFVQGIDSYGFAAIPFFFLVGEIMNAGGLSTRLLRLARALIGHIRGGLSQVNILASMVMAGVSGSAAADAAAVGSVMVPAMKRQGYPGAYAAAVTAASATIGPMIPPSIPLVIYGLMAGVSTGQLFLAGVVPGLLMGTFLLVVSYVLAVRRGYEHDRFLGWREIAAAAWQAAVALVLPVLVVIALVGGVATTTEVGALAVAYAVLASTVIYRELSLAQLWRSVCKAAGDACVVLVIASVAGAFTWIIANLGLGRVLAESISMVTTEPIAVLMIISVMLLLAGMVLEPVTILLVFVPMLLPLAVAVGIDLVHFGVVTVLATLIGMITPPVGFLIYVTAAQARTDILGVVRELVPFVLALVVLLMLLAGVPGLSLALPNALSA